MAENPGVFIRSAQRVELIIEGCRALMNTINCATSSIKGLKPDVFYEGYRVYFSDDSVVASFLKQRFLPLSRERASIHSLTTKLAVHDVIPDSVDDFREVLLQQLDALQLRPVLGICSIPISPQYPDIQSGDWLVELDIPEIEDLDIFKNNGLPDRMSMSLIFRSNATSHEKQVTFFCCICNDTDHSRQRCPHLENSSSSSGDESRDSLQKSSTPSRSPPRFEIRDRTQKNASTSSISKSAKQHRIEAIASHLERKKIQLTSTPKPLNEKREIKQEPDGELFSSSSSELPSLKRSLTESDNGTSSKKFRFATILENQLHEDTGIEASSTASSTTGRAESPIVVFDSVFPAFATNLMPRESTSQYDRANSPYEDYNVPHSNLPTSSQPETSFERSRHDVNSRDASDLSDSSDTSRLPRMTRKKPTYAIMVLPERIKQIVLSRDKKEGELDVSQLEAFFNHVKKKMSPAKIARQFTPDVNCLREQLKFIVQQYYMTPKAGSGEDSRFMKWLEGMLERFDYVPSKRKKTKSEPIN